MSLTKKNLLRFVVDAGSHIQDDHAPLLIGNLHNLDLKKMKNVMSKEKLGIGALHVVVGILLTKHYNMCVENLVSQVKQAHHQ